MSTPADSPKRPEAFSRARSFLDANEELFRAQLFELLRIRSVSSDSSRTADLVACAQLVGEHMTAAGLEVEVIPTDRHPIVYGERRGTPGGPSLLIYGHYDVQPVEPLDAWRHDPFEPVVENGSVVARGASDDKGQTLALLCGVRAAIESGVGEDVTIKFIVEGEEEIGSPSLIPFVRKEKERLAADAVVVADSSQLGKDMPAITYGLRGLACLEVIVRGPARDLHSGCYGGAVANPANVLSRLLAACQEPFGRIAIPGFYDRVRPLDAAEREELGKLPVDEEAFRQEVGAPKLFGEEGFSSNERRWARPTLDINGLLSGHAGEGVKTVLPATATAKLSMRLVPNQDPDEIAGLARDFILSLVPDCVEAEVVLHHGARPVIVNRDLDIVKAAARALETGFGRKPFFIREGGSIPVVNTFREELGIDTVLIGLGLPDDGIHGPNEKFSLQDYQRGMVTMAALVDSVSR